MRATLKTPRDGKVVAFINMKGGVGKTTSSVTLAETCVAEYGWRVLLVDLDAQASASYALCGEHVYEETVDANRTLATFFDEVAEGRAPSPLEEFVTKTEVGDGRLDIACAEPSLRYCERAIIERYHKLRMRRVFTGAAPEAQTRKLMADALRPLRKRYDLIVLDCPPGISIFAEAGVAASDLIVSPTIPDYLSTLGLKELNRKFLQQLRREGNLSGRLAVLCTKVQPSSATHKKYIRRLEKMIREREIDAELIETMISQRPEIARAVDSETLGGAFADKYASSAEELRDFAEDVRVLLETPAPRRADLTARRMGAA